MAATLEQMQSMFATMKNEFQGMLREMAAKITHHDALIEGLKTQATYQRDDLNEDFDAREHGERGKKEWYLDDRDFKNCPRFKGAQGEWDNWFHAFSNCCYKSPKLQEEMDRIVRKADANTNVDDLDLNAEVRDYRAALYRHLVNSTEGEAMTIVRRVTEGASGVRCGFGALVLLAQRFNPKTPSRILQHWMDVIQPSKVKDVRKLQIAVEQWETRKGRLATEFGEQLSENLQTAILITMVPRDLQDIAFQSCDIGGKLQYRLVRDRIMSIAQNRAYEMSTPTPMDIGRVGDDHDIDDHEQAGTQLDIDAIKGHCYNCDGWGHAARECASDPNLNKGKGRGKANSDANSGKDTGTKKGKSKGKGFQGKCFTCGEKGHSADRCRAGEARRLAEVSQEQDAVPVAHVESVWNVASVELDGEWHLVGAKGGKVSGKAPIRKVIPQLSKKGSKGHPL